jgi:hypothetical protein
MDCPLHAPTTHKKILKNQAIIKKIPVMPAKAGIHDFSTTTRSYKKPNHPNHLKKTQILQKPGTFHS